jgi:spermidine synthase
VNKYKIIVLTLIFTGIIAPCFAADDTSHKAHKHGEETGFWKSVTDFFVPHVEERHILLHKQTQYFLVTVEADSTGARHLVFNPVKGSQGIWNPATPDEIISKYCRYTTLFMTLVDQPPKRVLFIGLGVGMVPRFVQRYFPDTIIDVVEIDKDIPDIAHKYFGYVKSTKTNIIIKDGRDFINRTKHKYDIIFIDAYNAQSIPFQLTTKEFYQKIRNALKPKGIVTVNVANLGKPKFIASELKTIKSVFPNFAVYVCPNNSNYVPFAAVNRKIDPEKKADKVDKVLHLSYSIKDITQNRMTDSEVKEMTRDAIILTDDYAPVETMK